MRNMSISQNYCSEVQNSNKAGPEIHIVRMRIAVAWNIVLQFILFTVFVVLSNLNPFHPLDWPLNVFRTFLSINTWLNLLVLIVIIYIQGELCKKDYMSAPVYYITRFQKIKHIFSVRNMLLLLFYMVTSVTYFWIYSSVPGSPYKSLTKPCNSSVSNYLIELCLEEGKLFLILGGLWLGIYYFFNDYLFGSRNLLFPIIQQYKIYRIKTALKHTIKSLLKNSVFPTVVFLVFYFVYGSFIYSSVTEFLSLTYTTERVPIDSIQGLLNIQLLFYLWLFSSVFIFAMEMMQVLFNVHLTEQYFFPVTQELQEKYKPVMTLSDALKLSNVPIIHHLGYLDLFILATKSSIRREEIFSLSHPGGHPHTWNRVFKECTTLIETFTNDLNIALQQSSKTETKEVKKYDQQPDVGSFHFHSHTIRKLASPVINRTNDFNAIKPKEYQSAVEVAFNRMQNWFSLKFQQFYKKPYISYFFAESSDSRINYLLCKSQPVIWAVQSLCFLSAASMKEDRYGIVQRDLSDLITIIVSLKQVIDKLYKQNLNVKKTYGNDPLEVQMKYLLRTSVKRSLYKISIAFGCHVKDLRLPVDVEMQINNFIAFKEVL